MCIIVENTTRKAIDQTIAADCVLLNSDGFGIVYLDGTGESFRTLNMDFAEKILSTETRPYVAHCRFATIGEVNQDFVHPFPIGKGRYLFQNGTISVEDKSVCDTLQLAKAIKGVGDDGVKVILEAMSPTRFAVANRKTGDVYRVGDWVEHEGVYYSKDNVLPYPSQSCDYRNWWKGTTSGDSGFDAWDEPDNYSDRTASERHVVAVYGTLKYGRGNHSVMEEAEGSFLGYGRTNRKFRLTVEALPFLIRGSSKDGKKISVEVYSVDDRGLGILDGLEGHPDFYKRETITIDMDRGGKLNCYTYFVGEEYIDENSKFVESY